MSRSAFDRCVANALEGLSANSLNRMTGEGSQAALCELLRFTSFPRVSVASATTQQIYGFYGDGFLVLPQSPASASVVISAGIGARRDDADQPPNIGGISGLDEDSAVKLIVFRNALTVAVPSPPAFPNNRIDIIEVRVNRAFRDDQPVPTLALPSAQRQYPIKAKTLSYALDGLGVDYVAEPANPTGPIGYKTGIAAPIPVVPTPTPGYTKIAEIFVENVAVNPTGTITSAHVADHRRMLFLGGTAKFSVEFEFQLGALAPPVVLASSIPPGFRIAISRGAVVGDPLFQFFVLNNCNAAFTVDCPRAGVPTSFELVRGNYRPDTLLGIGDQNAIIDPARTFPTQLVPVNHPVRLVDGSVFEWTGVLFNTSTITPVSATVSGTLS